MAERPLPEGDQGDLDIRWIPARQDREIGPLEMGRGAERAQDVSGQGQVQHFLLDDVDQGQLPGLDAGQLPCGDAFLNAPLQRKLGVEVLAEQAVLEFAGLAEQVDELLPALNSQGRFGEGPVRRPGSGHTDIVAGRRLNTRCIGRGMAENERIPADFHQAMFRIAAIAFVTAATVDVGSSYIGAPHLDFTGIWIIGILSYVGAVVSWFFPWHRLPVERFLVVIVVPGLVLLGFMLMATGGVNSHILPIFIAPAVFMAAAYGFRAGSAIAILTAVTASLPLFFYGWDSYYARMVIVLSVATMLCAYIPARVRVSLLREYERRREQQEESYVATIGALAAALDAKDRYTEEHSRETAELAVNVGRRLKLPPEQIRLLEYGAMLHDVGKIGIPGYILQKPGPLTPEEFAIMREHPVIGERIVASVPFLAPLGPIVRAEHERWNGTGYPDGLKGEEIPIEARIIHACDSFHAMASDRAYRKSLRIEEILAEFRKESGQQFDPRVVDVMLELIEQERPEVKTQAQESGQPAPASAVSGPRSWAQHMQTIEALGQQLARTSSIEDICNLMGEAITALVPHDQCRVLLVNEERTRLDIAYLRGTGRSENQAVPVDNASVEAGEGNAGWVAESRRGVVLGGA